MKRLIIALLLTFVLNLFSIANATDWDSTSALKRVSTIGTKILKANGINASIEFKVSDDEDVNAYADLNKQIYVYRGLLNYVENDEELAGVISHEMGHIINGHCAKQGVLDTGIATIINMTKLNSTAKSVSQELASTKLSRNDEKEADITGVDLMTKAGYNPLAMISLLSKISSNYVDILQTHPSGEKRILNVYDYISYNYPTELKKGYTTTSYKTGISSISPTLEKRKNSKRLTAKYEKEQKKLLAKKEKRAKKMKNTNTIWDGYYTTLQLIAN